MNEFYLKGNTFFPGKKKEKKKKEKHFILKYKAETTIYYIFLYKRISCKVDLGLCQKKKKKKKKKKKQINFSIQGFFLVTHIWILSLQNYNLCIGQLLTPPPKFVLHI